MNIPVYFEVGTKRTFACAIEWPGWSRSGKDEASALETLLDYGLRYGAAVRLGRLKFEAPDDVSAFQVMRRLKGDATTDFGTPGCIPPEDLRPMDESDLRRLQSLLKGAWRAFDEASELSKGKTLKTGPRGGGRDRQKITEHVLGAEQAYLSKLGAKAKITEGAPPERQMAEHREAILSGVEASAHGELPSRGPRGGAHWPARYFVRRAIWHVLDHGWELEDRIGVE